MSENKTELFWGIVGDRVQLHFLYKSTLNKEEFHKICVDVKKKLEA